VKGDHVRTVLTERKIFRYGPTLVVSAFARGLWSSDKLAKVTIWLAAAGELPAELAPFKSRSRSLRGVRDPNLAMEWAYAQWDEYLEELRPWQNPNPR
jgi:hypothetical protein